MSTPAINFVDSPRRLRVCIVTETYPPEVNGVATTIGHLVRGLLDRGHRVQLIRPRQEHGDGPRREDGLEVVPQPGVAIPCYRGLKFGLPVARHLRQLWQQTPPDLVHIVTEGPLGWSALTLTKRLRVPVSSSFHTNFHSYSRYYGAGLLSSAIAGYLRRFHNRASCTLVPTAELAEQLRELGFANLRILSRGVDTRLFSPSRRRQELRERWGAGPDDPVLLYVGRLAAEKNLELAIQAFQATRRCRPSARFVLVGHGPLAPALRYRHPEFVFCGLRRGEELAAHYASADIFVFPSLTETFGNVVLEAMASGLAVVAFDYAAARKHLEHGRNGLSVPYRDSDAFVTAVQNLSGNPRQIRELGKHASQAAQRFDWVHIHQRLEDIFLTMVAGAN